MDWRWRSIIPVWVFAVVGAVLVAVTGARDNFWTWIPVAFGLTVVVTLAAQIATRTPEGYIHRAVMSILGSLLVFVVATVILVVSG